MPVVTPPAAAAAGLRALGAQRISILTPYTVETSRPMADYFLADGFEIASFTCLGLEDDREMARIRPDALVDLARRRHRRRCRGAVHLLHGRLRSASIAAHIEAGRGGRW